MRRRLPSPALAVALIALFVALGGGAYAGVTLATNSVRTATIANGQVKTADLGAAAVSAAKLGDAAATAAKLADGSVSTPQLADVAVTTRSLAVEAVTTSRIVDGSVATSKLADGATTARALHDGAVTSAELAASSVGSAQVADGSIGDADLAAGIAASRVTGTVAEAVAADAAPTAATLAGMTLRRVDFRAPTGTTATIVDLGGLRLDAACGSGSAFTVLATTSAVGLGRLHVGAIEGAGTPRAFQDGDFQITETHQVFPLVGASTDPLVGRIDLVTEAGSLVSVTFRAVRTAVDGTCTFQGFARQISLS